MTASRKNKSVAPYFLTSEEKRHFNWLMRMIQEDKTIDSIDIPVIATASQVFVKIQKADTVQDLKRLTEIYNKLLDTIRSHYRKTCDDEKNLEMEDEDGDIEEAFNI